MSKAERRASASGGAWKGEAGGLLLAAQERGGPCLGGGVDALLDGGGEGRRGAAPLRFLAPDEVPAGHGGERRVGGEAHVLPRAGAVAAKTGIRWLIRTLISGGPSKCPEPLWPFGSGPRIAGELRHRAGVHATAELQGRASRGRRGGAVDVRGGHHQVATEPGVGLEAARRRRAGYAVPRRRRGCCPGVPTG